ncbi:SLAP domain-containing protein, partial [Lactobacillus melliventris]
INGKSYYPLTGGAYVKAANVGVVNKQVQDGNLELNYNSYVYDKNGKRLYKFRGSKKNTHLRKGTPLKYSGSVEKIDRNSKQYFLVNDDNYNQSWLPYKKIGGKYYYNIGAGGYVNAANIGNIDNKPLYVAEATVTISPKDIDSKGVQIGLGKEQITVKPLQKIKVNRETLFRYDPTSSPSYIISGTKTGWFPKSYVQKEPRQRLLTFTADTYVLITAGTDIFDANGDLRPNQVDKAGLTTFIEGEKIPVDELLYIWSNKDNKAELYYHLGDVNGFTHTNFEENNEEHMSFIKAADSKYISGPFLKPLNTVDEAKADAKIATAADKKDLQKEIDQENAVHNTDG